MNSDPFQLAHDDENEAMREIEQLIERETR